MGIFVLLDFFSNKPYDWIYVKVNWKLEHYWVASAEFYNWPCEKLQR